MIDYEQRDFSALGRTFDVVLDAVGKSTFTACKRLLKPGGLYLSTDLGPWWQNPLLQLWTGAVGGKRAALAIPDQQRVREDLSLIRELVEAEKLRPIIDRSYACDEIVEAYRGDRAEDGQRRDPHRGRRLSARQAARWLTSAWHVACCSRRWSRKRVSKCAIGKEITMMRAHWMSAMALALTLVPCRAFACSWLARAISSSLPAHGAVNVPLDVAPIIRGYALPDGLVWEAQDGSRVDFDVTSGPAATFTDGSVSELVPRTLLLPHTRYVIRARGPGSIDGMSEERLEFTTGESTSDGSALVQPPLQASVLTGIKNNMCISAPTVACISVGEGASLLEIRAPDGELLVRDVVSGDAFSYIEEPGCIRVSRRSASGALSESSEVCGKALRRRPVRNELDGTHACRAGMFRPENEPAPEDARDDTDANEPAPEDARDDTDDASDETEEPAQDPSRDALTTTTSSATTPESESGCTVAPAQRATRGGAALTVLLLTALFRVRRRLLADTRKG